LGFRGPIMGSLKSPCTTSYWSSIQTIALNCLVFEKTAYFLSNAMQCVDRISIYLCVSVCVSVTLSVNSLTGQIPQRIFTVDSLKDADLRKDVPFWGLDDEQSSGSNIRVQSLPKPSFWGPNRHFKPNMRKIQIAVSSNLCVRLT